MTNFQIVYNEILTNNLMTQEELDKYISKYYDIPLYLTFQEWRKKGYFVKKGEKATIKTRLWYKNKRKIDKKKKLTEENTEEYFILVKSNLFGINQVQKIEKEAI